MPHETNLALNTLLSILAMIGLLATTAAGQSSAPTAVNQPNSQPWPNTQQAAPSEVSEAPDSDSWTFTNPFGTMRVPKPKMPQFNWRPAFSPTPETEPGFLDGPVARMKAASQDAAQKTRTAWNSTVEKLKFGGGAKNPDEPGFFARIFGPGPEPEGSRTVTEFLAQKRPGTESR